MNTLELKSVLGMVRLVEVVLEPGKWACVCGFVRPWRKLTAHHAKAVAHHLDKPAGSPLPVPFEAGAQLSQPPRAIRGHPSQREI